MADENEDQKSIWEELKGAGLLVVALAAVTATVLYASLVYSHRGSLSSLGEFGDSFGALTSLFNALAFSAVVATVVLQSRELRATRAELKKQAEAQKDWVVTTRAQLEQAERIEKRRLTPLINMEWDIHQNDLTLYVSNVGLGLAIIDKIDLYAHNQLYGSIPNPSQDDHKEWIDALDFACGNLQANAQIEHLTNLNRAMPAGKMNRQVLLVFPNAINAGAAIDSFRRNFRPVIHFRALDGQRYSTDDQFNFLVNS